MKNKKYKNNLSFSFYLLSFYSRIGWLFFFLPTDNQPRMKSKKANKKKKNKGTKNNYFTNPPPTSQSLIIFWLLCSRSSLTTDN